MVPRPMPAASNAYGSVSGPVPRVRLHMKTTAIAGVWVAAALAADGTANAAEGIGAVRRWCGVTRDERRARSGSENSESSERSESVDSITKRAAQCLWQAHRTRMNTKRIPRAKVVTLLRHA